jgi:hypothetical protein
MAKPFNPLQQDQELQEKLGPRLSSTGMNMIETI